MKVKSFLSIIILSFFMNPSASGSGLVVNANDPIYLFLQRLATRGIIHNYSVSVLSLKRDEIAAFLQEAAEHSERLHGTEQKILNEYCRDYRRELGEERHTDIQSGRTAQAPLLSKGGFQKRTKDIFDRNDQQEEKHLFVFEEGASFLWVDLREKVKIESKSSAFRLLQSDDIHIRGGLGEQLSFQMNAFRYLKTWNPDFPDTLEEQLGKWGMYQPDSSFTFDDTYASLAFHHKYFDIGLYRQPVLWGPSYHNNLILSGQAPTLSYFGFTSTFKSVRFSSIHAALLNDSTGIRSAPDDVRNIQKHLAAHRIDISLFKGRAALGFTDLIVYGNRGIELAYLTPVNFYWSIEHNLMDRDNSLLAIDFNTSLIPNLNFYGSLLIDELRFGELGRQWWANKQAVQAGLRWSTFVLQCPVNLQVEFSAVRPWTYTHQSISANYAHNGFALGFPYGPNSQMLYLFADAYFNRRSYLMTEYSYLRHGKDADAKVWGGDILSSYLDRDENFDHSTTWLMGPIETTHFIKMRLHYELFNDCYVIPGLYYLKRTFRQNSEQDLFMYIGLTIDI